MEALGAGTGSEDPYKVGPCGSRCQPVFGNPFLLSCLYIHQSLLGRCWACLEMQTLRPSTGPTSG